MISEMYDIYCVNYVLYYFVYFMMKRITGIVPQYTNEDDDVDDQFPCRYVVRGAITKVSCSASPIGREIQYEILSYRVV